VFPSRRFSKSAFLPFRKICWGIRTWVLPCGLRYGEKKTLVWTRSGNSPRFSLIFLHFFKSFRFPLILKKRMPCGSSSCCPNAKHTIHPAIPCSTGDDCHSRRFNPRAYSRRPIKRRSTIADAATFYWHSVHLSKKKLSTLLNPNPHRSLAERIPVGALDHSATRLLHV
jgi:hypothetical protein